jgi:hypothetical protein
MALVSASVLLTAALQQAAEGTSFSAASVVVLLVLASVLLVAFLFWQWKASQKQRKSVVQPVLSWDLLSNRVFLGVLL